MKVSTKGLYGTLAVLDLAIHHSAGHVHKGDIAERQNIPEQYLAQLLSTLRKAGYVSSVRGPAGGHRLAKSPSEICVGEIIELLDGPQAKELSASGGNRASKGVIHQLLHEANTAAATVLYDATFDKLVSRWQRLHEALDFVI